MGLQMIIGASGTGKSDQIYKTIYDQAKLEPDRRFFIIVPDQFTMQTQADMVRIAHGGIMNIDVLSFSRLGHRIFEELNCYDKQVLDDTGKSLILRRLSSDIKEQLPYLSSNLKRSGFVHEVKSSVSEFMQYDIGPDDLDKLIDFCAQKGALKAKLSDLKVLYARFLEYIGDSFITTEGSMGLLASKLSESELIRDSVVVFDGFTGFTPVQMRVVGELMTLCDMVYITLTLENDLKGVSASLFELTKKSYNNLKKLASERGIDVLEDIVCSKVYRYGERLDLAHLERNLFRYPYKTYKNNTKNISLYDAKDISDEVRYLTLQIKKLIMEGAQYRDIAVITGSLESYEHYLLRAFSDCDIPVYVDKTRAIVLNPMVEYTKSSLMLILRNFDKDSVIRFLRCGLGGFDSEETDIFENYCVKTGIRGVKRYESYMSDTDTSTEEIVNHIREKLIDHIRPLREAGITQSSGIGAGVYVRALYDMFEQNGIYEGLREYELSFKAQNDYTKEREYAQIYRLTMELFEQIYSLLGDDEITLEEFLEILDAGFAEITVGTIPQSVDKVIVGDMERSRLKPVKYLFFIGLNDGYVPKRSSGGSILSDMEREYLSNNDLNLELAPTPRQKIFIQRFYLYSNLVKPSHKLYMSYSDVDNSGKSLRPSYIVQMLKNIFTDIKVSIPDPEAAFKDITNMSGLKEYTCELIRRYAETGIDDNDYKNMLKAMDLMLMLGKDSAKDLLEMFIKNSFYRYDGERLEPLVAAILYGERMLASISRMEQFASCAYAYFLRYGLSLKEREDYSIDNADMGSIFHEALEEYGNTIKNRGKLWTDIDPEESKLIMDTILNDTIDKKWPMLRDGRVNRYISKRMSGVLCKAVDVLTYQLKAGEYSVIKLEQAFERTMTLDVENIASDRQERMELNGRIDRIDALYKDDKVYVKVIDYKTGNKDFSLLNLYYGLQLQLVVYLSESMKLLSKENRDKQIEPGALLYYRVADNTVNAEGEDDEEKIRELVLDSLKAKGLINDDPENVYGLTGITSGKSNVVNLGFNNNGGYTSSSSVMDASDMRVLMDYADYKLRNLGNDIISGNISKNPIKEDEKKSACTYCSYRRICGFDKKLEGYEMVQLKKASDDELIEKMKKEMEGEYYE